LIFVSTFDYRPSGVPVSTYRTARVHYDSSYITWSRISI